MVGGDSRQEEREAMTPLSSITAASSSVDSSASSPPTAPRSVYDFINCESPSRTMVVDLDLHDGTPAPIHQFNCMAGLAGSTSTVKRVLLARHTERMDRSFPHWLDQFKKDDHGWLYFVPTDLNQTMRLPQRYDIGDYALDPPLTNAGRACAEMLGKAILLRQIRLTHVYSSPSLRCVETASGIVQYYNTNAAHIFGKRWRIHSQELKVNIDAGLYERLDGGLPRFIEPKRLVELGYPVDADYKPAIPIRAPLTETTIEAYTRIGARVGAIIDNIQSGGQASVESILIVGHAFTVDAAMIQMVGGGGAMTKLQLDDVDLLKLGVRYPQGSLMSIDRTSDAVVPWRVNTSPINPLTVFDRSNSVDNNFALRFDPDTQFSHHLLHA